MQNYTEVYKSWCSIVSALSMLAPRFLCLRKRRRQRYHRNKVNRPVNPNVKEKKMYNKKTMDNGQFEAPLIEMRRKITIKQKMEVLTYFEEILKRKREANKKYHEPRPVGASKEALAAWHEKNKEGFQGEASCTKQDVQTEVPKHSPRSTCFKMVQNSQKRRLVRSTRSNESKVHRHTQLLAQSGRCTTERTCDWWFSSSSTTGGIGHANG